MQRTGLMLTLAVVVLSFAASDAGARAAAQAAPPPPAAGQGRLIVYGDMALFQPPGHPENCILRNRFKRGEPVGWRMFVADPSYGQTRGIRAACRPRERAPARPSISRCATARRRRNRNANSGSRNGWCRRTPRRHHPLHGHRDGQVRPDRRIQAVRGSGVPADHRGVGTCHANLLGTSVAVAAWRRWPPRAVNVPLHRSRPLRAPPLPHAKKTVESEDTDADASRTRPSRSWAPRSTRPPKDCRRAGQLDLLWETVDGGWVVEDDYHFRGKQFVETTRPLGQFEIGADGRLIAHFTIPEDYGGVHAVIVVRRRRAARPGRHRSDPDLRDAPRPKDRSARRSSFASRVSAGGRWRARGW